MTGIRIGSLDRALVDGWTTAERERVEQAAVWREVAERREAELERLERRGLLPPRAG